MSGNERYSREEGRERHTGIWVYTFRRIAAVRQKELTQQTRMIYSSQTPACLCLPSAGIKKLSPPGLAVYLDGRDWLKIRLKINLTQIFCFINYCRRHQRTILWLLFFSKYLHLFVEVCLCVCLSGHMPQTGQSVGVGSYLPSCRSLESNTCKCKLI